MDDKRARGYYQEGTDRAAGERPAGDRDEALQVPVDLRDTHANAGPAVGDGTATTTIDTDMPAAGPYPLPDEVERPFRARPPGDAGQVTVDPSLSRAVDRAAAGLDPEAAGYDRSAEGPPPGPLDPPGDEQDPDAGAQPAGQWGSSG